MHPKEVEGVKKFIEDGMPGLGDLKPEQIEAAVSMYMDGCTYQKISSTLSVKKQIVAFLAYKHDFYTAKMDMLASLVQSSKTKMEINHLKSVDFLTDMMSSIEARYRAPGFWTLWTQKTLSYT
jgi:TATA-binding protein-associated factor Taf7